MLGLNFTFCSNIPFGINIYHHAMKFYPNENNCKKSWVMSHYWLHVLETSHKNKIIKMNVNERNSHSSCHLRISCIKLGTWLVSGDMRALMCLIKSSMTSFTPGRYIVTAFGRIIICCTALLNLYHSSPFLKAAK